MDRHYRYSDSAPDYSPAPVLNSGPESGKALVMFTLLLVAVVGVGLLLVSSSPTGLKPEAAAYFQDMPEIPREGNGWFVLMGLDILPAQSAHEAGLTKYDTIRGRTAQGAIPPELEFTGDMSAFSCWYNINPDADGCPDKAAVDDLLSDNFDLLTRLETLSEFPVVIQPPGTAETVSHELVEQLFQLKMVELALLLENARPEDALEIWINGWRTLRMLSTSRVNLEWRHVFAELLNEWSGVFPFILAGEPEQMATGGKRRLFYLLRPIQLDDMAFASRLKHAGHLLVLDALSRSKMKGQKKEDLSHRLKNIYYKHVEDIGQALARPNVAEIYAALAQLRQKDHNGNSKAIYNLGSGEVAEAVASFHENEMETLIGAFQADLANNDYSRMYILDLDAFDKRIPSGKMQAHLDVQEEFMQCQITGKPFQWDPENYDIYCRAPDNLERRLNVLHLQQAAQDSGADSGSETARP